MAATSVPKLLATPASEQSIARFIDYATVEKGLSPLTLGAYRSDLQQLCQFLGGRQLVTAGRRDIGDFIAKLFSDFKYLVKAHSRGDWKGKLQRGP